MSSPAKFFLAQIVTFINLSLGILSIISSDMKSAVLFILAAALADRMDGKIARKLNCESNFGRELDSLSDLVSFGVAPAVVVWRLSLNFAGFWGYIPIMLFVTAGAFRLARFNLSKSSESFLGMPITIAGSLVAFITFFTSNNIFLSILLIILSFLMISSIKFKKI